VGHRSTNDQERFYFSLFHINHFYFMTYKRTTTTQSGLINPLIHYMDQHSFARIFCAGSGTLNRRIPHSELSKAPYPAFSLSFSVRISGILVLHYIQSWHKNAVSCSLEDMLTTDIKLQKRKKKKKTKTIDKFFAFLPFFFFPLFPSE
jgi:hypothetical protein